jgi:acetyl-CoA synthetase
MSVDAYEAARASHEWRVPARYNIAADVCEKHPRDKPAMTWESFDGSYRELHWGELQDLANAAAHVLAEQGVGRGDRVGVVLPPTPETAAIFFGVWKLGAILLSMSVLYGDDGIHHRIADSGAKLLVTDEANAPRFDQPWAPARLLVGDDTLGEAPTDHVGCDTSADDPAQLYYTSGTTGRSSSSRICTSQPGIGFPIEPSRTSMNG